MAKIYFSTSHVPHRKDQDRSLHKAGALIVCDGIGSFKKSGDYAENLASTFAEDGIDDILPLIESAYKNKSPNEDVPGGTTVIAAFLEEQNWVKFQYLGNGGIVHMAGNFAEGGSSASHPFRYADIMLPHVDSERRLIRHFSHNSGEAELTAGELKVKLNHSYGDIFLLFSDGVSSIENKVIVDDGTGRYFRLESDILQFILRELDAFLANINKINIQAEIDNFCMSLLSNLKGKPKQEGAPIMDDDIALGIIISEGALDYYIKREEK